MLKINLLLEGLNTQIKEELIKCCQPCVSFLLANLLPVSLSHRGIGK